MNIGKMMQQARKLQENMQRMQQELAAKEVVGEAGGGMVRVTMGGDRSVRRVTIDPAIREDGDWDLVEDLVAAAVNQALEKVEAMAREEQQKLMAGMPLPPGFSL